MKFFYESGGLQLESNVELSGLFPISAERLDLENIDVRVIAGSFDPTFSEEPTINKPFSKFNKKEFYFELPETVKMFIRDGKQVLIDFPEDKKDEAINMFYTNGLAVLFFQNDRIPFHVSSIISRKRKVWLFAWQKGAGKSTLLSKMLEKGYRFFSDDVCVVSYENNKLMAYPTVPIIKLWENSINNQSIFKKEDNPVNIGQAGKYGFFSTILILAKLLKLPVFFSWKIPKKSWPWKNVNQ